MELNKTYNEDCLETMARMPDGYVDCVVCSPPYWGLRAYKCEPKIWDGSPDCEHEWAKDFCTKCGAWKGTLGNEPSFELYIEHLLQIFAEVKRVLKKTGTLWVNLGDSYGTISGRFTQLLKGVSYEDTNYSSTVKFANSVEGVPQNKDKGLHKHLLQIPSRFAIAMTDRLKFILRNEIIWRKPNCMPSSAKDRFTVDFEKVFFFVKSKKYYFEQLFDSYTAPLDRWGGDFLKPNGSEIWNNETVGQGLYEENRKMRPNEEGRNMRTVWDVEEEVDSQQSLVNSKELKTENLELKAPERKTQYAVLENKYRNPVVEFRDLPEHDEIREYLQAWRQKQELTIEQIENIFGTQAPHHWFEKDGSFPTVEDWIELKKLLEFDDTFDGQMTTIYEKSGEKVDNPEGKNKRTVWDVNTEPSFTKHCAVYPKALIKPMIKAGCPGGGIVYDPFIGTGTTGIAALELGRKFIGSEISEEYCKTANMRTDLLSRQEQLL